jgi:hypothetical protein
VGGAVQGIGTGGEEKARIYKVSEDSLVVKKARKGKKREKKKKKNKAPTQPSVVNGT